MVDPNSRVIVDLWREGADDPQRAMAGIESDGPNDVDLHVLVTDGDSAILTIAMSREAAIGVALRLLANAALA